MKKKFLGILLATGLCFALAACGDDTKTDVTPTPEATAEATATPEPTEAAPVVDEGTSNTMTEDMVSITVTTNKSSYEAGEKIYYTIKVENNHELYALNKTTIAYSNSISLKFENTQSIPMDLPQLFYGSGLLKAYIVLGAMQDRCNFPGSLHLYK